MLFLIVVSVVVVVLYAVLCGIVLMYVPLLCVTEKRTRAALYDRIKGCHWPESH